MKLWVAVQVAVEVAAVQEQAGREEVTAEPGVEAKL
jgi:hypothetical protein